MSVKTSRLILAAVFLFAGCGESRKADSQVADSDLVAASADSIDTIRELEKSLANEATLFIREALPVRRVAGLYSDGLSVDAVRIRIRSGDATSVGYYASIEGGEINESISEFELASATAGLDSLISIYAIPAPEGIVRDLTYQTKGGVRFGVLMSKALRSTAYVSNGVGGTTFLATSALPDLKSALLATRDSIAALKGR